VIEVPADWSGQLVTVIPLHLVVDDNRAFAALLLLFRADHGTFPEFQLSTVSKD